jgi:hypothetical protein
MPGVPFDLAWGMILSAVGGMNMLFDNSADISFLLPEGYSLTSVGGYAQGVPVNGVPEPGSLLLLASGLAGIIWRSRRRRVPVIRKLAR